MNEKPLDVIILANAVVLRGAQGEEKTGLVGSYEVECRGPDGEVKWRETVENTVMTLGKNVMLDSALAGSSYTVTGPYMGLISSASYTTGPSADDTMAAHGGWLEAGSANAPTYTAPRKTCVWSSAASGIKALSAALSFPITGNGTVKGCFLVFGAGASSAIGNTSGTLLSAGVFSGGDKVVSGGDSVNVSYSLSLMA